MSEADCIFCKIARKEIAANEVARTDDAVAFADLNPQAPEHLLVVPLRHAETLSAYIAADGADAAGRVLALASRLGRERAPQGYRLVVNEGSDGGQTVFHMHVHVLGGRHMGWPPG